MHRKNSLAAAWFCAVLTCAVALSRVHADPTDEIKRLAALMDWKPGSVVADIGAGDGGYAFAAAEIVGPSGRIFATEIDQDKLAKLRSQVSKRHLTNVVVLESKTDDTNLPAQCCDAIFLRRVYHHLTKPADFDAALLRSLKPGGRLAIIEFPPRSGLEPVEGVPANRGGHGIPRDVAIQELTDAGFRITKRVDAWPEGDYLLLFEAK
jgi:ubiquinone/menaquinone biosynthesis C-methylase UbiE